MFLLKINDEISDNFFVSSTLIIGFVFNSNHQNITLASPRIDLSASQLVIVIFHSP